MPHAFDLHLGRAIRATRVRRDISRETLAARSGIALSNLKRREDGTNETTVRELERIAAILRVPAREIVDMALTDYSGGGTAQDGLRLLLDSVSDAPRSIGPADEVPYIGRAAPALRDAAYTAERSPDDD